MAAPVPKPKEQRINRHPPRAGEWVDIDPPDERQLPELEDTDDHQWTARQRTMWEGWAWSAEATQWNTADVLYALELLTMMDNTPVALMSEVRIRLTSLGLSPKGKRDLRWRIPQDKNRQADEAKRHAAAPNRRAAADAMPGPTKTGRKLRAVAPND